MILFQRFIFIVALAATIQCVGCAPKATKSDGSVDPPIELKVGGTSSIELRDVSASSGYVWKYSNPDSNVVRVSLGTTRRMLPSETEISVYMQQYVFTAMKPGTATIVFEQRRPWVPDGPPTQTKTVVVNVEARE